MEQLSIVINDMEDVTKAIDNAQRKACTSIVEIGYVLRKADDAELFRQKGYSSIFEFAKQEYGWDKAQTSRFMAINREYSKDGYSTVLKEQYEGYGQAKLSEMLMLPENIREEITPDMKRDEIREVKKEYQAAEEARKYEDFGKSLQAETKEAAVENSLLEQSVRNLFEVEAYAEVIPNLWPLMCQRDTGENVDEQDIFMTLRENGHGNQRAGSCMYFFKKDVFVVMRGMDKEEHSYNELLDEILNLSEVELSDPSTWYIKTFGKNLPASEKDTDKMGRSLESPRATGDLQKKKKQKEKELGNVDESPKVREETVPITGQTQIDEFAEKMPIEYEKEENKDKKEGQEVVPASELRGGRQIATEQKMPSETVEVVPDVIEGECQYCAGNKDIETNDGSFKIHLTSQGTGRIELDNGLRYGIIEFEYCPKCGRKLEEE